MTVSATSQSITHDCVGTTGPYPFLFGIGDKEEIKVVLTDSEGVEDVLVYVDEYSVDGVAIDWDGGGTAIAWDLSSGGTVTTVASYAVGNSITIMTDISLTQETSFTENMATLYKTFENALDKLTRIVKEFDARIVVLELYIITGGTIPPATITYLGKLTTDPSTSGWGSTQAFTCWFNTTQHTAKYWDGTQITEF